VGIFSPGGWRDVPCIQLFTLSRASSQSVQRHSFPYVWSNAKASDESKQINTSPAANFVILDFQIGVLTTTVPPMRTQRNSGSI
jgi:hypothetical protein